MKKEEHVYSSDFLAEIIGLLAFLNFQQVTSNSASNSVSYNSFTTERYIRLHANSRKHNDFVACIIDLFLYADANMATDVNSGTTAYVGDSLLSNALPSSYTSILNS